MQKVNITVVAKYLGLIAQLLRGKQDFYPLYNSIRAAAGGVRPTDMESELTVEATESEVAAVVKALIDAPQGHTAEAAKDLKISLSVQIANGLKAEGNEMEVVLENGEPALSPASTKDNPIPLMQPKIWARIARNLQAELEQEEVITQNLINSGWDYLTA